MKKRIVGLLLCLVLAVAMLPLSAFGENTVISEVALSYGTDVSAAFNTSHVTYIVQKAFQDSAASATTGVYVSKDSCFLVTKDADGDFVGVDSDYDKNLEANTEYYLCFRIELNNDYVLTENVTYTLNGTPAACEHAEGSDYYFSLGKPSTQAPAAQSYVVKFVENNGSENIDRVIVEKDAKVTAPSVTYSGHNLVGWCTDESLENAFDIENTAITGNTTLYAEWQLCVDELNCVYDPAAVNLDANPDTAKTEGELKTAVSQTANVVSKTAEGKQDETALVYKNGEEFGDIGNGTAKVTDGREYWLKYKIEAKDGCTFAGKNNENPVKITVNGFEASAGSVNAQYADSGFIYVFVKLGTGSTNAHTHVFDTKYTTTDTMHWLECTDESCEVKKDGGAHTYPAGSNVCSVCGYEDKNMIADVKLTITKPVKGEKPAAVGITTTAAKSTEIEVEWFKATPEQKVGNNWNILGSEEQFAVGYYYMCRVKISHKEGFAFAKSVTNSVNGTARSNIEPTGAGEWIAIGTEFAPIQEIKSVTVTVDEPVYGAAPSTTPTIESDAADALTIKTGTWYKCPTAQYESGQKIWRELGENETFTEGYYYWYYVQLKPVSSSFVFADKVATSINGTSREQTMLDEWVGLNVTFSPIKLVKNISATITAPKYGKTPDTEVTTVENPDGSVNLISVYWYKIEKDLYAEGHAINYINRKEMAEGEKFTDGYYYMVDIIYEVAEGYQGTNTTTGTINNRTNTTVDYYAKSTDSDLPAGYILCTAFEPLKKPNTPSTGDNSRSTLWAALALASIAALGTVAYRKKRSK